MSERWGVIFAGRGGRQAQKCHFPSFPLKKMTKGNKRLKRIANTALEAVHLMRTPETLPPYPRGDGKNIEHMLEPASTELRTHLYSGSQVRTSHVTTSKRYFGIERINER
ncbi:hypothetical protein TM1040_0857 [Ruegeria sp. TM1040]|nr:hypothetical protein TM1040_0857 [Ruegeria sp. TM1040]